MQHCATPRHLRHLVSHRLMLLTQRHLLLLFLVSCSVGLGLKIDTAAVIIARSTDQNKPDNMACAIQGCELSGSRKLTDGLRERLGLPADCHGLICHKHRQPGLAARHQMRKEKTVCAACSDAVLPNHMHKYGLSARDSNLLAIPGITKPRVCKGCYSKLTAQLRLMRNSGQLPIHQRHNQHSSDVRKENTQLRKELKVADAKARRLEDEMGAAAVLDGKVLRQPKSMRIWDSETSKTTARRFADFVVEQVEYLATPAASKTDYDPRLSIHKRQFVDVSQPLRDLLSHERIAPQLLEAGFVPLHELKFLERELEHERSKRRKIDCEVMMQMYFDTHTTKRSRARIADLL